MEKEPKPRDDREIDLDEEVLNEAFQTVPGDRMDLEKKILAIAFLIESSTGGGNKPLEGAAANGFATVLRDCAEDAAKLRRELRRLDE